MTGGSFSAQVDQFVRVSKQRMEDMFAYALSEMINDMQTPTAKGGRMRVDTGFLRASGRGALDGWPSGNGEKPADAPVGQYTGIYDDYDGRALDAILFNMELGDTFFWGWVANYGAIREIYDGFMEAPLQNWQTYVNTAVAKVKKDIADAK